MRLRRKTIRLKCHSREPGSNPGLGAYISGYIPVRRSDSKRSTLSTNQQTAVISVIQQPFQVANARMIEVFIEELDDSPKEATDNLFNFSTKILLCLLDRFNFG
ncbi:MAG: hypothetical protein ACRDF4_01125 [Rhabdochlamydiaceae bacterium]